MKLKAEHLKLIRMAGVATSDKAIESYSQIHPVALTTEGDAIILDGMIVDSETDRFFKAFGLDLGFVTPEGFRAALKDIKGDLTVRVNSPGGSVFDASVISGLMMERSEKSEVNVVIEGLAASAASFVALSGTNVKAYRMAMIMIHNSWVRAQGNADDLRSQADILSKIDKEMSAIYSDNSSLSAEDAAAAMKSETWYSAEEAMEIGMVDEVIKGSSPSDDKGKASAHRRFLNLAAGLH